MHILGKDARANTIKGLYADVTSLNPHNNHRQPHIHKYTSSHQSSLTTVGKVLSELMNWRM